MNVWKSLSLVALGMLISGACMLLWQKRDVRPSPAATAARTDPLTMTNVHAGGVSVENLDPASDIHQEYSGYDVSEGKRLYTWFNCNTCHANGGGDIGPPLMDDTWIYGSEPRNIFATILEGRPNGMPSYRGKIPDAQVWQLVAYVRSMSGLTPKASRSSRNDDLSPKPPETLEPTHPPKPGKNPAQ